MGQFREVVAKAKRCIFLHIENEKLILGPYEEVYFSAFFKNCWFTKGSARMVHFREVVAKAKICIFLHIENEKLILGLYEEVYFSAFFKKTSQTVF